MQASLLRTQLRGAWRGCFLQAAGIDAAAWMGGAVSDKCRQNAMGAAASREAQQAASASTRAAAQPAETGQQQLQEGSVDIGELFKDVSFLRRWDYPSVRPWSEQGSDDDFTVPVLNWEGKVVGEQRLPADVFGVPVEKNRHILHTVVRWQRAKKRQGTACKKSRSEVRGSGRKISPQKGQGRARHGSIRAPQFRKGGLVFPPKPKDWSYKLNKKVRRLGVKVALSAKSWEKRLTVLDNMVIKSGKTAEGMHLLDGLLQKVVSSRRSALLIDGGKQSPDGGERLRRALRNLPDVDVLPYEGINVYSILLRDHLFMTQEAVEQVVRRLQAPIKR